jgi:hypothetical protein
MVPTTSSWKVNYGRFGKFRSYWLPDNPVDGEWIGLVKAKRAYTTLPLRHRKVHHRYVTGGPWNLFKEEITNTGEQVTVYGGQLSGISYAGRFQCRDDGLIDWYSWGVPGGFGHNDLNSNFDNLELLGVEALNSMKPTKPDFTAAASLYELKDLPGLLRDGVSFLRHKVRTEQARRNTKYWYSHAGEWYLSIQFGYVPLIRDILNFTIAFRNRKARFDQLLRDEGKWVRRRRNLKQHDQDGHTVAWNDFYPDVRGNGDLMPTLNTQSYGRGVGYRGEITTKVRTWCTGRCKYFLPSGPRDRNWRWRLYLRMLGGRPSLDQLWAVIPWSWLVDYFVDMRSFMGAISEGVEDRLIWDKAYIMQTREAKLANSASQVVITDPGYWDTSVADVRGVQLSTITSTTTRTSTTKLRCVASIFGFGATKDNLSPTQLAILGALGLSRL